MSRFKPEYIELLARKYKEGTLNEKELADFQDWYTNVVPDDGSDTGAGLRMKRKIDRHIGGFVTPWHRRLAWRITAAASLLCLLSVGYFFSKHKVITTSATLVKADAAPGRVRAMLTLANGQVVNLDATRPGDIAGTNASKSNNNQLVYNAVANNNTLRYNTLTTPAGGEYQVVLVDGTKVWLNAASKLIYPEHFSDTARLVTLEGEAYFEVAHENKRPFRVSAGRQEIQVLGTHFNINAYSDEPRIVTTLVQGSVRVRAGIETAVIKPGEQAQTDTEGKNLTVKPANVNMQLAWKNGMIMFEDAPLSEVMRQAARWYNIKVRFIGNNLDYTNQLYTGGFSRNSNLVKLLEILKANHISFDMKSENGVQTLEIGQL